jgi:hypothetical protein
MFENRAIAEPAQVDTSRRLQLSAVETSSWCGF